jgi:hypothetical protein
VKDTKDQEWPSIPYFPRTTCIAANGPPSIPVFAFSITSRYVFCRRLPQRISFLQKVDVSLSNEVLYEMTRYIRALPHDAFLHPV